MIKSLILIICLFEFGIEKVRRYYGLISVKLRITKLYIASVVHIFWFVNMVHKRGFRPNRKSTLCSRKTRLALSDSIIEDNSFATRNYDACRSIWQNIKTALPIFLPRCCVSS